MSFKSLGLHPALVAALEQQNFHKPYPIQQKAIPTILSGNDVLGIAKTGSGKTASYVLPILTNLEGRTEGMNRSIRVLVLVPTRELAVQVTEVFAEFGRQLPYRFKAMAVFGGVSINPQMKALQNVNVLVATPGRLLELSKSNAMSFSRLKTLVLDEADKMLNLGFKEEMDEVLALLPKRRQNLLFSATLSPEIQRIEEVLLRRPEIVHIQEESEPTKPDLIDQTAYFVSDEKKGPLLRHLIQSKNMQQVLVFTSSTHRADLVSGKLHKNGISSRAIHGKKSQGNRTDTLSSFKAGNIRVLVTTDLLSRGIDIDFLPYVINYELPRSPKDFIHRIGRTGRAENPGEAISFITPDDQHHFKVIQKKMKQAVTMIDSENIDMG